MPTTHAEIRRVPYTPQEMYALVAAVDRYPEFLPWCAGARIRSRRRLGDHEEMIADLVISFKLFRERYASRVRLFPPGEHATPRILVENLDGMFRLLRTDYVFRSVEGGCEMGLDLAFEFRNVVLQKAGGLFFEQAMRQVAKAFEDRAAALYGPR